MNIMTIFIGKSAASSQPEGAVHVLLFPVNLHALIPLRAVSNQGEGSADGLGMDPVTFISEFTFSM